MGRFDAAWDINSPPLEVGPKQIPVGSTDEVTADCWILELYMVNDGSGAATVSVYDRQSPPVALFPSLNLPKGGMISLNSRLSLFMPGGITWTASAAGVSGRIAGHK